MRNRRRPRQRLKWTRKIARELRSRGIDVGPRTVARLLRDMNFSLRVNRKQISHGATAERDPQFRRQTQLRDRFARRGDPIVSVDTKKRELVGRFKNTGRAWTAEAMAKEDARQSLGYAAVLLPRIGRRWPQDGMRKWEIKLFLRGP